MVYCMGTEPRPEGMTRTNAEHAIKLDPYWHGVHGDHKIAGLPPNGNSTGWGGGFALEDVARRVLMREDSRVAAIEP